MVKNNIGLQTNQRNCTAFVSHNTVFLYSTLETLWLILIFDPPMQNTTIVYKGVVY